MFRHRSADRLALLVLTPLLAAPLAAQAGDAHAQETHPNPAYSHHREDAQEHELVLPVTGMTPDKLSEVKSGLMALTTKEFVCPDCGHTQEMAGKCMKCDVALKPESRSLVREVTPSSEKGTVTVGLVPTVPVRLSVLEKALKGASVGVQRDKLTLQGPCALVFEGAASQSDAMELQKALRDDRLWMARASYDDRTREVTVHGIDGSHTWAEIADLGKKATKPEKLVDVVWGGMTVHAS